MRLVIVCGSPRNGNTEWMLKHLHGLAVADGAESELLLLRKLDVKMCNGCLACEAGGKNRKGLCTIKDDMQGIYPKLLQADAIHRSILRWSPGCSRISWTGPAHYGQGSETSAWPVSP
jgi:multimeric flavodoxin WrbA